MTKIKNLFVLMLVLALGIFSACDDDTTELTEQQKKTKMLAGDGSKAWKISSVDVGANQDYAYAGDATITFTTNNTYTISGEESLPYARTPYAVLGSGSWAFPSGGTNFNSVILSPQDVTLTIITLEDSKLVFSYPAAIGKAENAVTATVTAAP